MLIDDARAIYYGDTGIYRVYLGDTLVWGISYLTSKGNTSDGGYTIGTSLLKSTDTANKTTLGRYAPGEDFTAERKYWPDWGNDIFDGWGFFYLYDPNEDNYLALNMSNMQEADGVFSQDDFIFNGRTFTVTYGYAVQGVFKIDISVDDHASDFIFGMDGNLGSDTATANAVLAQEYTLDGQDFKLHYNRNYQSTLPTEDFYTYFVPYEATKNKDTRSYVRYVYSTDNLSIYSVPVKRGITVYVAKQNDVKDWIINDLQLGIE